MLNRTYRKNILRDIRSTKSRFFSIFGIVLLGVAMLTGLMSVAPDMRSAADSYFKQDALADLRVVSTLGLTDADIAAIAASDGVAAVQPTKSVDCEVKTEAGDTLVMRAQSLPATGGTETDATALNRLWLKDGRMPEKDGECAVQALGFISGIAVGDTVTVTDEGAALSVQHFTVVGLVQSPANISIDAESTTAGDGTLDFIAYLPARCFTADYYTTCWLAAAGAGAYSTYSKEYDAAVEAVSMPLEALGETRAALRRAEIVKEAEQKLADARAEYEEKKADAERQLDEAAQSLADAEQKLKDAKAKLDRGERDYTAGQKKLADEKQALPGMLQSGASELLVNEQSVLDFEDRVQQIRLAVAMLDLVQPTLLYAEQMLGSAGEQLAKIPAIDPNYSYYQQAYESAQKLYDEASAKAADYQAQMDKAKAELYAQGLIASPDITNDELSTQAAAALQTMKLALTKGQLSISTGTATAYAAFERAAAELKAARATLDAGWQEYRDGCAELEDGRAAYASAKAETKAKLADAEDQIIDAQEQIDDIAAGEWYVLNRDTLVSYVTFEQNADRIEDIARVFPVFFFLVAALVSLTTMTRMVEENRLQIGALKALGYSSAAISAKYLLYALAANLSGAAAGILVGFAGFPSVIWYAYSIMYTVPGFRIVYDPTLIAASLVISTAIICAATLAACRASLAEKPASLLLPKAPAAGKRILLERIGPLWRRMKFSHKVTARNLMRYKKRFFMTVLGVAGCTALLLVGFGLQDSIMDVVDSQFPRLNRYDLSVSLSDEKALSLERGVKTVMEDAQAVKTWGAFYEKSVAVRNADGQENSMTLMVAEDAAALTRFFTFQTRRGHTPISFDGGSVILTEKTAETLGLVPGNTVWLELCEGQRTPFTVTGVCENYIFSRIFVARELYEKAMGAAPAWNTLLAESACGEDEAERAALSERLLAQNYVSGASFIEETTAAFTNTISCINYVVLLVIVCAAALAAIVLYNLININIAERKKELATIKVLGFYEKEVRAYIFREIDILSFLGALAGLCIGAPLHQFIIRTVEIDQMMFIRAIALSSYVYSVALTMLFTAGVSLWMRRSVREISMVESMKAPE